MVIHSRQKKCHICSANIDRAVNPQNRQTRFYYRIDEEYSIDEPEVSIYSILSWHLKDCQKLHQLKQIMEKAKNKNKH